MVDKSKSATGTLHRACLRVELDLLLCQIDRARIWGVEGRSFGGARKGESISKKKTHRIMPICIRRLDLRAHLHATQRRQLHGPRAAAPLAPRAAAAGRLIRIAVTQPGGRPSVAQGAACVQDIEHAVAAAPSQHI